MSEPQSDPDRFQRRIPSKRDAPDDCQNCRKDYGPEGPIWFRKRWLCSDCLLLPSEPVADRADDGVGS